MKSVGDNRDEWEAERLVAIQTMTAVAKKALLGFIKMLGSWLHTHKDAHMEMSLCLTASMPSSGGLQTLKHAAKIIYSCLWVCVFVCIWAYRCVNVTFACNMNPKSNPRAKQALLPKAMQCQQALPKPSQTHTCTHLLWCILSHPTPRACIVS